MKCCFARFDTMLMPTGGEGVVFSGKGVSSSRLFQRNFSCSPLILQFGLLNRSRAWCSDLPRTQWSRLFFRICVPDSSHTGVSTALSHRVCSKELSFPSELQEVTEGQPSVCLQHHRYCVYTITPPSGKMRRTSRGYQRNMMYLCPFIKQEHTHFLQQHTP